jgi:hypothetical protein
MGSPRRPTEFGYKARVADTADGFVIADVPERDGPVDGSLLDGAISKAKRAGMQARSVYADPGFGTSTADAALAHQTPGVSGVMASTMLLAVALVAGKRGRLLGVKYLGVSAVGSHHLPHATAGLVAECGNCDRQDKDWLPG